MDHSQLPGLATPPMRRQNAACLHLWCSNPLARWVIGLVVACIGFVLAVVFLIWTISGFVNLRSIGLSGSVLVALSIGIVVSDGLGAGLMALVFQNGTNGQDDEVYHTSDNVPAMDQPAAR